MLGREDSDSDAPEEFTAEQAIQKDEQIRTISILATPSQGKSRMLKETVVSIFTEEMIRSGLAASLSSPDVLSHVSV
ncbi:hypothetical protein L1887_33672 [Cichorium endivia]|nr:hypothetical protein L1887_33672 [Cichorium endivia]